MRTYLLLGGLLLLSFIQLAAQRSCLTAEYSQSRLTSNPTLADQVDRLEHFIQNQQPSTITNGGSGPQRRVIRIPVVVHILYHGAGENISDEQVRKQIDVLNSCFRKKNADTANIPAVFRPFAADCEIEFHLAISDPQRRSTSGIIHKYTPVTEWQTDDKMKFSAETGDNAWDPHSYLNIWVCNLRRIAGYTSVIGDDIAKDGIVIDFTFFGPTTSSSFGMGKTAVHEVGHWLGLKHIWGDAYCGDDLVGDTPKQGNYTMGCPTNVRSSCSNGASGDMYMNYMDYTNDPCLNLFTEGQKNRMHSLFADGGPRSSLVYSTGLSEPLIVESPLPDEPPRWLHPQVYPNPASNELIIDLAYDARWIGKILTVTDVNGRIVMQVLLNSKVQTLDISKLRTGLYFLTGKKEDGSSIKQKFIKM